MSKVLPLVLMLLGGAVGAGTGFLLKPPAVDCAEADMEKDCAPEKSEEKVATNEEAGEEVYYLAMKSQFVVPVIQDERVRSLVVLSLSLETTPDHSETLFAREPKMRDVFLQVLFDHAHIGGFDGAFTESSRMTTLKTALLEAAQYVVGEIVSDVIITDIVRQEM